MRGGLSWQFRCYQPATAEAAPFLMEAPPSRQCDAAAHWLMLQICLSVGPHQALTFLLVRSCGN